MSAFKNQVHCLECGSLYLKHRDKRNFYVSTCLHVICEHCLSKRQEAAQRTQQQAQCPVCNSSLNRIFSLATVIKEFPKIASLFGNTKTQLRKLKDQLSFVEDSFQFQWDILFRLKERQVQINTLQNRQLESNRAKHDSLVDALRRQCGLEVKEDSRGGFTFNRIATSSGTAMPAYLGSSTAHRLPPDSVDGRHPNTVGLQALPHYSNGRRERRTTPLQPHNAIVTTGREPTPIHQTPIKKQASSAMGMAIQAAQAPASTPSHQVMRPPPNGLRTPNHQSGPPSGGYHNSGGGRTPRMKMSNTPNSGRYTGGGLPPSGRTHGGGPWNRPSPRPRSSGNTPRDTPRIFR